MIYTHLIAAALAALVAWGVQTLRLERTEATHTTTVAALRAQIDADRLASEQRERAKETQRTKDFEEVAKNAQAKITAAQADAAAARAVADRLRQQARAIAASAGASSAHPRAAAPGAPAPDAARVLADMLSEVDSHAGTLAAFADAAHVAGAACERAADTLSKE